VQMGDPFRKSAARTPADLYAELISVASESGKRTLLDCSGSALRPAVQAQLSC